MIANHYPLAFATRWSWVILALVLVIGAVIRHFYNVRHQGLPTPVVDLGRGRRRHGSRSSGCQRGRRRRAPRAKRAAAPRQRQPVDLRAGRGDRARPLQHVPRRRAGVGGHHRGAQGRDARHAGAHPPHAHEIALQAVQTHAMPPGNITEITPEERQVLAAWIAGGAKAE